MTDRTRTVRFQYLSAGANLAIWDDTLGTVSNLWSNSRGKGHGSDVMRQICEYADKADLRLVLVAKAYDTPQRKALSTIKLIDFYKKFGFKVDPGLQPVTMMTRLPRVKNID